MTAISGTRLPDTIEGVRLRNGQPTEVPDGTWFALAPWDAKARDYVEDPSLGIHSRINAAYSERKKIGVRAIRYTVHNGYVTTRRAMS